MKEEKRQFPRLNLSVEINWEKISSSTENAEPGVSQDGAAQSGTMKDISAGGIRLIVNDKVKPGDILELDIKLTEGKSIHLKGKVIWVEKYEVIGAKNKFGYEGGIQFLDVSDEVRLEISNFIFNIIRKGTA